jgi:AcrR family transcriptional regulator
MTSTTPRERRHARTRQEILEAALEILYQEGPDKLSLREIARRVDYSPAGLYEYFDNKEAIIDALCQDGDRRLQTYLLSVPNDLPPYEYLVELGLAYIRYARSNPDHFLLQSTRLMPEMPSIPFKEIDPGETFQILLDAVQRAIEAGVILPQESSGLFEIAYSLWALGHGAATLQLTNLKNVELDYENIDRAALESMMRGLGNLPGEAGV